MFDPDHRQGHRMEEKMFSDKNIFAAQNPSPSLSEIEGIYKGSEPDNFGNMNKKYIERYPMDLNDEDISVMKKFIHHKKDELPSEMFYMDVETFKKLYVQNRVMEMKREASRSRRSSVCSNVNEQQQQDKIITNSVPADNTLAQESHWVGEKDNGYNQQPRNMTSKTSSSPRHYQSTNLGHTPIEYGSPKKKSVAVQMQQEVQKRDQINQLQQQQQQQHHLTYSQKQALKDFDAYELKNLELENKKLTVINDDLLKLWEQTQAENTRLRLE